MYVLEMDFITLCQLISTNLLSDRVGYFTLHHSPLCSPSIVQIYMYVEAD